MNDNIYDKQVKPTSRKQYINMRLALLGDELARIDKEKIEILAIVVELKTELRSL
jgi:hypothetical protein